MASDPSTAAGGVDRVVDEDALALMENGAVRPGDGPPLATFFRSPSFTGQCLISRSAFRSRCASSAIRSPHNGRFPPPCCMSVLGLEPEGRCP